ncbi:hypothetical protein NQZ68_001002 [Dissostichus eleginoides]|nr:hypothetical protein NQZ68_001002 [Dissostichus eleginoides]
MENTQGKGGEGFIVADRVAAQAAAEKLAGGELSSSCCGIRGSIKHSSCSSSPLCQEEGDKGKSGMQECVSGRGRRAEEADGNAFFSKQEGLLNPSLLEQGWGG